MKRSEKSYNNMQEMSRQSPDVTILRFKNSLDERNFSPLLFPKCELFRQINANRPPTMMRKNNFKPLRQRWIQLLIW